MEEDYASRVYINLFGSTMSYSLNSSKGGYVGDYTGEYYSGYWRDTGSLELLRTPGCRGLGLREPQTPNPKDPKP